ncbi:MAG: DUF6476 family protein [Pseudomonadota bacterium]
MSSPISVSSSKPQGDPVPEPEHWGDVPQLRGLRRLVIVLTATLSLGVLTVAAALVIRIMNEPAPAIAPVEQIGAETIALPEGEIPIAAGTTASAISLVTKDANGTERLRIYAPDTGALIDTVIIQRD